LLSVTINEFPVPTAGSDPTSIVTGPDGNLWFTESAGGKIAQINPTTHVIAEFPVPTAGSEPTGITTGPDGNLWFVESDRSFNNNKIGQINPTTHAIAEFPVPSVLAEPRQITAGPDGNLWFTEENSNKIGEINPTTHVIAEFLVPTAGSLPFGIAAGPDGNVWFTENGGNKIGQINPTTHVITEFPIPTPVSLPLGITAGPDGNLWFIEEDGNQVGRIDPTTHTVTEFAVPTGASEPFEVTAGADGDLWFTERAGGKIGQINPATHAIAEFPIPTNNGNPDGITAGPDGNLWFTELAVKIGQAVLTAPPTAPDLVLAGDAPSSANLGSNVTYTLTVTNDGTARASGVTLTDTLPAGITFVSTTGGVSPVNGVLTVAIGDLDVGSSASITIVVTPLAAGPLRDQAVVSMKQTDPTPNDDRFNGITAVTTPVRVDGPIVTRVQRFGFHERPTILVLTFDEPLDPVRAQNLGNYQIVALGCNPHRIRIKEAVYDAVTRTVTLKPVQLLNLHHRFRLTVIGTAPSGLTDISGNLLDGRKTGSPGSNFVTIVTARNLVLTPADPAIAGSRTTNRLPYSSDRR
jgi:uncharacterized repeat protein (TIGR01451 family)